VTIKGWTDFGLGICLQVLTASLFLTSGLATCHFAWRFWWVPDLAREAPTTFAAVCFCLPLSYISGRAFWGVRQRLTSGKAATQLCLLILALVCLYVGLDIDRPFDTSRQSDWKVLCSGTSCLFLILYLSYSGTAKNYFVDKDGGAE
jgi:hypothetical protein